MKKLIFLTIFIMSSTTVPVPKSNPYKCITENTFAYLECLDELIDAGYTASQQITIDEYNRVVDLTQKLGDEFNQQVRAYRARQ